MGDGSTVNIVLSCLRLAFDTVSHNILKEKLGKKNPTKVNKWVLKKIKIWSKS